MAKGTLQMVSNSSRVGAAICGLYTAEISGM